jgi:hypothetical protein
MMQEESHRHEFAIRMDVLPNEAIRSLRSIKAFHDRSFLRESPTLKVPEEASNGHQVLAPLPSHAPQRYRRD